MARTYRTDYRGNIYHDGGWGKKCPEPDCNVCVIGAEKRTRRRKDRREGKRLEQ